MELTSNRFLHNINNFLNNSKMGSHRPTKTVKGLNNFQSKKLSFNAVSGCFRNAMMSDALPVLFGAVEDTF